MELSEAVKPVVGVRNLFLSHCCIKRCQSFADAPLCLVIQHCRINAIVHEVACVQRRDGLVNHLRVLCHECAKVICGFKGFYANMTCYLCFLMNLSIAATACCQWAFLLY